MRKIIALGLLIVLTFGLVACGGKASSEVKKSDEPITLKFATQHPLDHIAHSSAEAIKERVERETEGRVLLEIYPASQLGDWSLVYEEVIRGTIEIAHISVPEKYDARVTVGFLPYLAKSYDQLREIFAYDSLLSTQMEEIQAENNVKFLGYYCEGFSGIGTVDELVDPASSNISKDALVRVSSNDVLKFPAERLGFRTSTIPYNDTFAAMQTGVVDGWVGGPPNLNYLTFRDVINYYYHYNLTHESTQYIINNDIFENMSKADQEVIEDAFREQCEASFDLAEADDEKFMEMMEESGIEVIKFSDEELEAMASDIRENVWPKFEEKFTKELLDGLRESLVE